MKYLFLITLPFASTAKANTYIEVVGGTIAYHPQESSENYSNQALGNKDTISPMFYGVRFTDYSDNSYTGYSAFGGRNSFNQEMFGGSFSVGHPFDYFNLGIAAGAYHQPPTQFDKYGIVPFMGVEVIAKIPISKSLSFNVNSMLSFQLMNAYLSLAFKI